MTTDMMPERCVEHRITEAEILSRLKTLETDVKGLYAQLKDKVDNKTLQDVIDRSTREIEELKKAVIRLNIADNKHSESLAGIRQILEGFKETQDLLRQDYSKLAECYTQSSVHMASITAILAERARKEGDKETKIEVVTAKDPWYVRFVASSKAMTYAIIAVITALTWLVVKYAEDILVLLGQIFDK